MAAPTSIEIPVDDGALVALRWGPAEPRRLVLALHGITGNAMAWEGVSDALPADTALVALDLRGRGHSRDLPGPWGLDRHAADTLAAGRFLAGDNAELVLTGHSMGAYVAGLAAYESPAPFSRVVLVDGGVPLPVPPGLDPDEVMAVTLGPALARLRETYASVDAYLAFFRAHPALGPNWNDLIEHYVRYDVLQAPDGVRSRAVEDAVRDDGRSLLTLADRIDAALRGLSLPVALLTAPAGMFGEPPPLLPPEAVAAYGAAVPGLAVSSVPGTNHYTILFAPDAARTVAAALTG